MIILWQKVSSPHRTFLRQFWIYNPILWSQRKINLHVRTGLNSYSRWLCALEALTHGTVLSLDRKERKKESVFTKPRKGRKWVAFLLQFVLSSTTSLFSALVQKSVYTYILYDICSNPQVWFNQALVSGSVKEFWFCLSQLQFLLFCFFKPVSLDLIHSHRRADRRGRLLHPAPAFLTTSNSSVHPWFPPILSN